MPNPETVLKAMTGLSDIERGGLQRERERAENTTDPHEAGVMTFSAGDFSH